MLTFRYASRASQGARHYQEDSEAVWPGPSPLAPSFSGAPPPHVAMVAVLADGMGGHAAGDVASSTICKVFLEHFLGGTGTAVSRLAPALEAANEAIRAKGVANPSLGGMGATCVGLVVGDQGASWISVGDSPLWRFRDGQLERLNEDHSLAPLLDQLVASGEMNAEEAASDPRRHYLRSAVTGEDLDLVDTSADPLALSASDIILLASDGVLTLADDEILQIIANDQNSPPEVIADALIGATLAVGDPFQDNITVVVVKVEAGPAP